MHRSPQERATFLALIAVLSVLSATEARNIIVGIGSSVDIQCPTNDVSGSVTLEQSQSRSGPYVTVAVDGTRVVLHGAVFTIHNLTSNTDRGYYQCRTTLPDGRGRLESVGYITVFLSNLVKPRILVTPSQLSVVEGASVTLTCTVQASSQVGAVTWYKDATQLADGVQDYTSDDSLHKNTLRLTNVGKDEGGMYECRVKNSFSYVNSYNAEPTRLIVKEFKILSKSQDYLMAIVGDSLKVNCITSDPNATVSLWVKKYDGVPTRLVPDDDKLILKGTKFVLQKVTLSDEGLYSCEGRNQRGKVVRKTMGQFIPSQGGYKDPKAHIYPSAKILPITNSSNFSCVALGDMITFSWLKNGTAVPANHVMILSPRVHQGHILNEALLMIRDARKDDAGIYTCRVTSGLQPGYSHSANAKLVIEECRKPSGKFPDPSNINGYIECKNNIPKRVDCPDVHQHWNDTLKTCQDPPAIPTTPFLRWIGKNYQPRTVVAKDSTFVFDCRTNDPALRVTLILKQAGEKEGRLLDPRLSEKGQIFTLTRLAVGRDGGKYSCRVSGLRDKLLTEIHVDRDLTLTVDVTTIPSRLDPMEYGDSEKVMCYSSYRGDVTWYRVRGDKSEKITKGVQQSETNSNGYLIITNELSLTNVTKEDAGSYMCEKKNRIGATAQASIYVPVLDTTKPSVNIEKNNYSAEENEVSRIRCVVSGSPWPKISWYRGGIPIVTCEGGQFPECPSRFSNGYRASVVKYSYSELEIKNSLYPRDNAMFACVATNVAGSTRDTAALNVLAGPMIQKNKGNSLDIIMIPKGAAHKLRCKVIRANPIASITWQWQRWPCSGEELTCKPYDNNWMPLGKPKGKGGAKIVQMGDYNSTLLIQASDSFAFYRCVAENKIAKDSLVYEVRRTISQSDDLLTIKDMSSSSTQKGSNKKYYEHRNITLGCTGHSAFDAPPYWVDKENRRIESSGRVSVRSIVRPLQNTTILEVVNASPNDTGHYTCAAKKKNNRDIVSTSIFMEVVAVSAPTVRLDDLTTNETSSVALQCHVTGNPPPTVRWYKDGRVLSPRLTLSSLKDCKNRINELYHLDKRDNEESYTLVVCKASYNDSGSYECQAVNSLGQDKDQGYLDVQVPPSILRIEPDNFIADPIKFGEVFYADCFATGNPTPKVQWKKETENGTFTAVVNSSAQNGHSRLYFASLREDDLGNYECVAVNSLGTKKKIYRLMSPPTAGKQLSRDNNVGISKPALIGLAVTACLVIAMLLVIIGVLYRRKKLYGGFYIFTLPPMEDYFKKLDPARPLLEQTHKLPWNAEWEFPRDRIKLLDIVGTGAFGQVFLAEAVGIVAFDPRASLKGKGRRRSRFGSASRPYQSNKQVTRVACKGLKENATDSEYRDLLSELKILMHIGEHKNIVNLLGACTKGRECDLLVIIEYCPHGNLLNFLRKRRDVFEATWSPPTEKPDETFTLTDLVITSFQVSRAMQFLASRRCVHRDLAARNVLVGENYVMKIADFGLARDIYKEEHYVKTTAGLLPVKWMAIEALVDQVYTHSSDVWSFGVLLWEIFTLGGSPYPGLPANEVYQYLMEGQRMAQPEDCPQEMYDLMLRCWQHDPAQRPTFTQLLETIDKILEGKTTETGEEYLDLENDTTEEQSPEYLLPEDLNTPLPPETPMEDKNFPLPPVPFENIELKEIPQTKFTDSNDNKKAFTLADVPKRNLSPHVNNEIDKVQRDSLERERTKKSESSASSGDSETDALLISEKEKEKNFEDKDICERNSGVFNDSPSLYINTMPCNNTDTSKLLDMNGYRKDRGFRPREQSARYV